jgi:hypothetical protein
VLGLYCATCGVGWATLRRYWGHLESCCGNVKSENRHLRLGACANFEPREVGGVGVPAWLGWLGRLGMVGTGMAGMVAAAVGYLGCVGARTVNWLFSSRFRSGPSRFRSRNSGATAQIPVLPLRSNPRPVHANGFPDIVPLMCMCVRTWLHTCKYIWTSGAHMRR